eukprot:CAMPEP_0195099282 /NCGR_PEP_ID=MMETSP0448-20130528/58188_1 /TAXON_ID=66468 /ORGANISM="Heterocapsa triquestra, Strain CCMP 448" /LENGTH=1293 /DNA_ID=CAMNT_0040134149 /DNA_START=29 /DNA_END=3910 /DNA_ORIENTATION=+
MAKEGGGAPALAQRGADGAAGGAPMAPGGRPRPKEASRRPADADKKKGSDDHVGQQIIGQIKHADDFGDDAQMAVMDGVKAVGDGLDDLMDGLRQDGTVLVEGEQGQEADAVDGIDQNQAGPGAWSRMKRRLAPRLVLQGRGMRGGAKQDMGAVLRPEEKKRLWELKMSVRGLMYVGKDSKIDTFFAVSLVPTDRRLKDPVRLLSEYTPATILHKEERFTPTNPIVLWSRKHFKISYKDLDSYDLKVAMWRVSPVSFNTYYGIGTRSLRKIVNRDANVELTIKEKLTKEKEEAKRKRTKTTSDVAVFSCTVNFEEVFDFQLIPENWNLEMLEQHHDFKKRKDEKKCLKFVVPKDTGSDASRSRRCSECRVDWKEGKFNWSTLGRTPFVFRGTSTALQNQYLLIRVFTGKPQFDSQPPTRAPIGVALLGLTSVLDISVFRGNVKALDTEEERFNVATVTGSIKAIKCSVGEKGDVEDVPGGRPEQPKAASTVTHLNPGRYLVVRVTKCDNLAVADFDKGSSDPYLRVSWDSMVLSCAPLKFTTKPVFNHTFFFPVRLFNQKLEKSKKYRETALKYEMKSKGDLQIQVWDDDETSSDSLGAVVLPLWQIMHSKQTGVRTLQGSIPKPRDDEEEEDSKGKQQWYENRVITRYYDGQKTPLSGCTLPNSETAVIYFEAFFYPDWKADLVLDKTEDTDSGNNLWQEKEKEFNKENVEFYKAYAVPFPDAIGARPCKDEAFSRTQNLRRFPCVARHPQMPEMWLPLPAFLCRIITPEEYLLPAFLLHWISCISFANSSKQERQGRIPENGWKDPQTFLFTRKGPVQDHALLLCSVLLGSKKDAWVCKGMIKANEEGSRELKVVEHTWVMTREQGDWVTFWEPCTREVFHLPKRWRPPKMKKKKRATLPNAKHGANGAVVAAEDAVVELEAGAEEEEEAQGAAEEWDNEIADMRLGLEDIEGLPTVGRMPKPKQKVASKKKAGARDKLREHLIAQRENLPQAPKKELLKEELLVDWLPYDSIDVVFNDTQLYANRQNHHPACITFDFEEQEEEQRSWSPLLSEEDRQTYKWRPINTQVVIDPAVRKERLAVMEQDMVSELEENMRLYRQKAGLDTFIEKGEKLIFQLDYFLSLLEEMRGLDLDHCPLWKIPEEEWKPEDWAVCKWGCGSLTKQYNKHGMAFTDSTDSATDRYKGYDDAQKSKWERIIEEVWKFLKSQEAFPTSRGKVFKGFPVHFSTSDPEEIRTYLMQNDEYQELLNRKGEGLLFTIYSRMFGMLGGIQSTWLYFGVQIPMEDYDLKEG